MADAYTAADGLGIYLTGAARHGEAIYDPEACLGGYRSSVEETRIAGLFRRSIAPLRVDLITGINGVGQGTITAASTSSVYYTAPSDIAGATVSIANGETKWLPSNTANKAVRVTRDSANALGGYMTLDLTRVYNNVIGGANVADADRTAGLDDYRALMLRAHGASDVTAIKVWKISGNIEFAFEVADANGAIQTIADLNTAPAGVSWNSGTTSGTGLSHATLAAGDNLGLWIHRTTSAGATASPSEANAIAIQFVYGGTTYDDQLYGYYRIANDALERYIIYIGQDVEPDFSSGAEYPSLPFSYGITPPVGDDVDFRVALRYRNKYGLTSLNTYSRSTIVDSNGDEVTQPLTTPDNIAVRSVGGGCIQVTAQYQHTNDASPGDTWAIYYRADGVDPDAGVDTPTEVLMSAGGFLWAAYKVLSYTLGPFAQGEDVRVLVRAKRSSDGNESANTTATQIDIDTMTAAIPYGRLAYAQDTYTGTPQTPTVSRTVYIDQPNNIYWQFSPSYVDLYGDSVLIWRLKYDSSPADNNGFWTTFGFTQETISGAAGATPVEVASWTAGDKRLYVAVAGVRRMEIDVTNTRIKCAAMQQVSSNVVTARHSDPAYYLDFHTLFQVWNRKTWEYATAMSLDNAGVLAMKVPYKQRTTTGAFE